jgi:hypothetical protein
MGFFDRFFNKPIKPSITKRPVPQLSGGMTAHQAWAVVAPMANAFQGNSARAALRLQERPFARRLRAISLNNLNTNIAEGMNGIRLQPMSFRFGKPSRLGG